MQHTERKVFGDPQTGRLNSDDAAFSLGPNEWVNMENCRTGTTDSGFINNVEAIGSTEQLSSPQPSITFNTIGSIEDTENQLIVYFKKDLYGPWDRIEAYFVDTGLTYLLLSSAQVTGGLNFDLNSPIHSIEIVNDILYWCEGTSNQPRALSIYAAIKANDPTFDTDVVPLVLPVNFSEITLIKPPPTLAPNIEKKEDVAFLNNFIANESFRFAFQYVYYTNETTVVGTYGKGSRLNKPEDDYNYIQVTMDPLERIPNSVKLVQLIVRLGTTGNIAEEESNSASIIKTWDKSIPAEAQEIEDQNNVTAQLSYYFYGNITGISIPPDLILKPFDNIPIYCWALGAAKNRLFLGNNVEGYDTPLSTSLAFETLQMDLVPSSFQVNLIEVRHRNGRGGDINYAYSAYYVKLAGIANNPDGYYELTSTAQTTSPSSFPYPTLPPPPVTFGFAGLTFRGTTWSQVALATAPSGTYRWDGPFTVTTSNLVTITGASISVYDVFKNKSQYQLGIVFYDFAMRKCGVVTNDSLLVSIPQRDFAYTTGTIGISWALNNANALTEIPDWAYYYCIVRTLNLKTRYFIESFDDAARYATKDVNGVYTFNSTTFITGSVGVGLNTTALNRSGLGYQFTQGDICVLIRDDDTTYELPVIDQVGNYIIVRTEDIGDLAGREFSYEIYTPYAPSVQEPFFEVGEMYRVVNPGTVDRQYEIESDILDPDSYVLTRNFNSATYLAEGMSPNDIFFNRWDNDTGKITYVLKLGQQSKTQFISFSDVYIPGTAVNGLSTFGFLNQANVPEDCGPIRKLILTSKVQDEGTIMLSVCENETNSIYLGESQIVDSTGAVQFFAQSNGVIGTINTLKGSFGTINPESVVEYRGRVFFYDAYNGKYIQYSSNGLFPISNYKMTRFWKQFSDQYLSMTSEEIESLGSRPFVFSTVDPHHDELLISIPKLLAAPPKGYLPDYPGTVYPFDIWDGQAKTLVYKLDIGTTLPHWQGAYTFAAENFVTLADKLYSFKNGILYRHNSTTSFNNFYGTQYKSRIMYVSNMFQQIPKSYNSNAVEANMTPTLTYLYSDYPYQQASDLMDFDYTSLEGVWYATFYRNKLVPTATGFTASGLLTAEKMRAAEMYMLMEFTVTDTLLALKFINIRFSVSRGHATLKAQ